MRLFAFVVALLGVAVSSAAGESEDGIAAPDFDVQTIDETRFALGTFVGHKPVYLKFWLSTCPQCMAEMPHFRHTYERFDDRLEVIAVNLAIDETMTTVEKVLTDHDLTMTMVFDESGEMQTKFGVYGTPTHIIIDRAGRIAHVGTDADEELDQVLMRVTGCLSESQ